MKFKLLAIKPLKGCLRKYRKIVHEDTTYYFYHNFNITETGITEDESPIPAGLFSENKNLQINVSAIVGKNGSGKSALVELMYGAIYTAALTYGIINKPEGKRLIRPTGLSVEIFWQKDDTYYALACVKGQVRVRIQDGKAKALKPIDIPSPDTLTDIKHLFYTIAINYSHYSLNSLQGQQWLRDIFNKNDGYQVPLVISPFRENGIININNENSLTIPRVVSNLLTIKRNGKSLFSEVAPGRVAEKIKFTLYKKKSKFKRNEKKIEEAIAAEEKDMKMMINEQFKIRIAGHTKEENELLDVAYKYLLRKLYLITTRYTPYKIARLKFIEQKKAGSKSETLTVNTKKFQALLNHVLENPSHITLKLLQTINFIKNITFYTPIIGKFQDINILAREVDKIDSSDHRRLIEFIPPPFFSVDIEFKDRGTLRSLSSGEKQKMFTTASWVYHLLNLLSVREDDETKYVKYNSINIIFDEIELYFHPEMQRRFVQDFLQAINSIQIPAGTGINCLFVTHSPFILSDIPNNNILFLKEDGLPDELTKDCKTFGANIHELLKNNFFLEKGTIGEFAQKRIESAIQFMEEGELTSEKEEFPWTKQSVSDFIDMISEPVIRKSLRALYLSKSESPEEDIQIEISKLQDELKKINKSK